MKSLVSAPFNQILEIHAVDGDLSLATRLRELGFRPGVQIQILGQAPFNGPLLIQIHSNVLALRINEAECVSVK